MVCLNVMNEELRQVFIECKGKYLEDKRRLGLFNETETEPTTQQQNDSIFDTKNENVPPVNHLTFESTAVNNRSNRAKSKDDSSGCPLQSKHLATSCTQTNGEPNLSMLSGERAPHVVSKWRSTRPYLEFGEYETRRQKFLQERKADLKEFLEKQKQKKPSDNKAVAHRRPPKSKIASNVVVDGGPKSIKPTIGTDYYGSVSRNLFLDYKSVNGGVNKAVQTEQHADKMSLVPRFSDYGPSDNRLSLNRDATFFDTLDAARLSRARARQHHTNLIVPGQNQVPSTLPSHGILRDNSPRARLMADLRHSYYPYYDSSESIQDQELLRMNRLKWERARQREEYQEDLRKQIEEKQRQALESAERERREEEALTRRLERQLDQLKAERERDETRRAAREQRMRTNTESFLVRQQELQAEIDREKRNLKYRNAGLDPLFTNRSEPSTIIRRSQLPLYDSPPLPTHRSRVPYSFNIPQTSMFANTTNPARNYTYTDNFLTTRSDKSSEIHKVQTSDHLLRGGLPSRLDHHHSHYRSFEDSMPMPVLRTKSPVAESLKYSRVVDSQASTSTLRHTDALWKIPTVPKSITFTRSDSVPEGRNRSVLTQLGAIRLQLQQEQLRLDETMRRKTAYNLSRP